MGSLKAEIVDENTPSTTIRLDLVCVPNLVVFGPAVLEKKHNQTEKQMSEKYQLKHLYIYIYAYMHHQGTGMAW